MDFKNITPKFDFDNSENSDNFVASITHQLFTQIVKEEDEYTLNIIEEYVKNKQHEGECIAAKIIPEGKLRHIINLGLNRYAAQEHIDLKPGDLLFPHSGHVVMYIGNNQIIHAPQTGDVVKVSPVYKFYAARRVS